MPAATLNSKYELIQEIKSKITEIHGNDSEKPVNLDDVSYRESGRSNCGGKINITCLFINEEGNVCADMYRTGAAGCVDFICGLSLDSINEKFLMKIISALNEKKWSVEDYPVLKKEKKRNLVSAFKIPFFQKGA